MKRLMSILLVLVYLLSMAAIAEEDFYYVAKDEGLTVKSLEHFVRYFEEDWPIQCDRIVQEDNWYSYQYRNYGLAWAGKSSKDTKKLHVWESAKTYAQALCGTGYFECIKVDEQDDEEFYILDYIGPGEVNEIFRVRKSDPKAAVVVASYLGDVKIYYSVDIVTSDLQETAKRLGVEIGVTFRDLGTSDSDSDSTTKKRYKNCSAVGCTNGKIKCSRCNGNGGKYVYDNSSPNYSGKTGSSGKTWEVCTKCRGAKRVDCPKCDNGKVEY